MNLMSGSVAVWYAFNDQLDRAAILMVIAACFDFLDGFAARWLKVSGELGKQLDSLADMVSFGLLPGVIAFSLINYLLIQSEIVSVFNPVFLLWPLWIPALSALRLAQFNIDTRQTYGFIGLPTPANALFWASLGCLGSRNELFNDQAQFGLIVILAMILIFSLLLVSNIPMFALKFKSFNWKDNQIRYIFLLISALLVVFFKWTGVGLSIVSYIVLSVIMNFFDQRLKKTGV